ncbi:activator of 90 kDa heat shock protein ATPase homolog 1-like isoform X2 [Myxocyprinus asiaticus]|uniref:activator of 90 kDa heat shock protein ATPase homolog 1-like isoform X2 n=1 Tax=Myxocyprinus asiaticus TaxID=70543 RepID=UPI002221A643|nr:activator of 90 kDa heat shock protein ATPase homolog 1-like isoform X2 [Myxocyprinus asiaticus]
MFWFLPQTGSSTTANAPNTAVKISTVTFSLKETFLTLPEELELYMVFLNQEVIQAFTRIAAFVDGCSCGKFQLMEGNVHGQFAELIPDKKIVMKWRFSSWPAGYASTVTLNFVDRGNETELIMEAKGVPSSEEKRMKEGWQRYYFEAIKQTFGYGARLC